MPAASAQESNLSTFEQLGLRCLLDAPTDVEAFRLSAPDSMTYLRTALTNAWIERGKRVSLGSDSTLPTLRYSVQHAAVSYRRIRRNTFRRDVTLSLDYSLLDERGTVLDDGLCMETAVDTLYRADLGLLENPVYPETVGARPEAGFIRRIVEPAVMIAAVGIGVFLFFSLRSEGSSE